MSLQVYEFSRELDISQKNGRLVSGGFRSEVGQFNHPVPEKIKDAVNRGDFRIDDNYPPEEQEYALIAREIDEFSILAVASGEIDDKARPLVAYRYFWLSQSEEKIDGIGTLLIWWLNVEKPKFEFSEAQIYNDTNDLVTDFSSNFDNKNCKQFNPQLSNFFEQIRSSNLLLTKELTKFSLGLFHLLAVDVQKQSNISLAWAWNVKHLEHPDRFHLIWYFDKILPCIVNNIHQRKNSIKTARQDESSVTPVSKKVQLDEKTSDEIKKCLLDIVNHDRSQREKYLQQLTKYIEEYPIDQWNWKNITEAEMSEKPLSLAKARYIALLVIFGQIQISDWLYWLQKQRNDKYTLYSFDFQMQFVNQNHDFYDFLEAGIINLLLQYTSVSLKQEQYKNIEWLLIKSNTIWDVHFKYYSRKLLKQLICRETRENDKFCQKVIENIEAQEFQQRNNQSAHHFSQYTPLARLFESIGNYVLSAFFYQLSSGTVPSHIFNQDYVQIIPITQDKETENKTEVTQNVRRHRFSIFHFLKSRLEIILLITLMILGVSAITYVLMQENFLQPLEQNNK